MIDRKFSGRTQAARLSSMGRSHTEPQVSGALVQIRSVSITIYGLSRRIPLFHAHESSVSRILHASIRRSTATG